MQLNPGQSKARDIIHRRLKSRTPVTEMTGPAGTGKSTLIAAVLADLGLKPFDANAPHLGGYIVCAPTNKAASLLRRKGIAGAMTAHAVTSGVCPPDWPRIHGLQSALKGLRNDPGKAKEAAEIREELARRITVGFSSKGDNPAKRADLIVVDEAGMLGQSIASRLLSLDVPILAAGDPYQLPPVGEKPYFLQRKPDIHLSHIERQGAGSAILELATLAREGRDIPLGRYGSDAWVLDKAPSSEAMLRAGRVIVGKHVTRREINNRLRRAKGIPLDAPPQGGEPVVCVRTEKDLGVFASDFLELSDAIPAGAFYSAKVFSSHNDMALINTMDRALVWRGHFDDHLSVDKDRRLLDAHLLEGVVEADLAYAVTCHRMQGDEADNVLIVEDGWGASAEERRRWLYTALTRARRQAVLVRR